MHMSLLLIISWYISLIIKIHWHTKNTFNLFPFSNYFLSLFPFSKLYCVFPRSCYFPFFDAEYVPITLIIKTTVFLPCQYLMIIQFRKMQLVMVCLLREFCLYRVLQSCYVDKFEIMFLSYTERTFINTHVLVYNNKITLT